MLETVDVGTQYRSAIYYADDEQRRAAEEIRDAYEKALRQGGYGPITTEIAPAGSFYYADGYHQQYLHKVRPVLRFGRDRRELPSRDRRGRDER